MALLEERPPSSPVVRREQAAADKAAVIIVAAAWCLTLASILGLPGPDFVYMGAAPAIVIVATFPALMGIFLQRYRGGFARLGLLVGVGALVAVGGLYAGKASASRTVFAYFLPAALLLVSATLLAAPRLGQKAT
ncbi:MAG TPA: hypothetical protein VG496_06075 [Myxococcales bacterium]|nr:hypothetical protein [Myxococcales bacterium]